MLLISTTATANGRPMPRTRASAGANGHGRCRESEHEAHPRPVRLTRGRRDDPHTCPCVKARELEHWLVAGRACNAGCGSGRQRNLLLRGRPRAPMTAREREHLPGPLGLQLAYTTGVHTLSHLRANAGTPTPAAVHRGEAGRARWAALAYPIQQLCIGVNRFYPKTPLSWSS